MLHFSTAKKSKEIPFQLERFSNTHEEPLQLKSMEESLEFF